jgi:hypothetical protein
MPGRLYLVADVETCLGHLSLDKLHAPAVNVAMAIIQIDAAPGGEK